MIKTKREWLLYTFGIFMIAPLTLLLLMGFGQLISVFANPSALGPIVITLFPIIPIGALILWRSLRKKREFKALKQEAAKL